MQPLSNLVASRGLRAVSLRASTVSCLANNCGAVPNGLYERPLCRAVFVRWLQLEAQLYLARCDSGSGVSKAAEEGLTGFTAPVGYGFALKWLMPVGWPSAMRESDCDLGPLEAQAGKVFLLF